MSSKVANFLILFYYVIHVPITLFCDSQVVLPSSYYPSFLLDAMKNYTVMFEDKLCAQQPTWFWSMTFVEVFVQFPFFFVSIYAFLMKRNWIRIPTIIYGSHVATTLIPILGSVLFDPLLKPKNDLALCGLVAIYSVWLVFPVWMTYYAWVNEDLFATGTTTKSVAATNTKKAKSN